MRSWVRRPAGDGALFREKELRVGTVVMLTREGIEHRYVAQRLAEALGDDLTAILVHESPPRSTLEQLRRSRRRYTTRQFASRLAVRVYRRATNAESRKSETMRRILFPSGDPGRLPLPERTHVVASHNDETTLRLLDELSPDVIAVYGTMIIRPPTIAKAKSAILNMHTGISPRYRGADTYFWPLFNREPEWIGVTIHHLDPGVDSGAIISVGRPDLDPDDDPDSLFAKCVLVGADLYSTAVRSALDGSLAAVEQDLSEGRNYLSVERTVRAERRVKRLLRGGLLRSVGARA
jgi:methionyl-tRNA formyltransferase